jgi:SAM-dependent methyltransferase
LSQQWSYTARTWDRIRPPLKPVAEDLQVITRHLADWHPEQVMILGVTREYLELSWPHGSTIRALDYAPVMFRTVWKGAPGTAILGDWRDMPVADGSQDLVLLDAGLCLLRWPRDQQQVIREVSRILAPGGLFIIRVLVLPAVPETPARVMQALEQGAIPDLSQLRIRLWMAMQYEYHRPATNRQFWYFLRESFRGREALAHKCDTTLQYIEEITRKTLSEPERDYEFADQESYLAMFTDAQNHFRLLETSVPGYGLGERCPTFVLRKNPA